jgi:hypothetical protein
MIGQDRMKKKELIWYLLISCILKLFHIFFIAKKLPLSAIYMTEIYMTETQSGN